MDVLLAHGELRCSSISISPVLGLLVSGASQTAPEELLVLCCNTRADCVFHKPQKQRQPPNKE